MNGSCLTLAAYRLPLNFSPHSPLLYPAAPFESCHAPLFHSTILLISGHTFCCTVRPLLRIPVACLCAVNPCAVALLPNNARTSPSRTPTTPAPFHTLCTCGSCRSPSCLFMQHTCFDPTVAPLSRNGNPQCYVHHAAGALGRIPSPSPHVSLRPASIPVAFRTESLSPLSD